MDDHRVGMMVPGEDYDVFALMERSQRGRPELIFAADFNLGVLVNDESSRIVFAGGRGLAVLSVTGVNGNGVLAAFVVDRDDGAVEAMLAGVVFGGRRVQRLHAQANDPCQNQAKSAHISPPLKNPMPLRIRPIREEKVPVANQEFS
jgi:hypothetical protein